MAGFRRRVLRPPHPLWQHQQRHRRACVLTTSWTQTHEVVTQPTFTQSIVRQPHVATHVTPPTTHSIQRAPTRRQDDRSAAQSCGCEKALKTPGQALVAPSPSSTVHVADVANSETTQLLCESRAQLPAPPTGRSLFYMRACPRSVWGVLATARASATDGPVRLLCGGLVVDSARHGALSLTFRENRIIITHRSFKLLPSTRPEPPGFKC